MGIIELITGGFLAQLLLIIFVWGTIAFLAIKQSTIPDALLDAGFLIIGFYFHQIVSQTNKSRQLSSKTDSTKVLLPPCDDSVL